MPNLIKVILYDDIIGGAVIKSYRTDDGVLLDFSCRVLVSYGYKHRVKAYVLENYLLGDPDEEVIPILEIIDREPLLLSLKSQITAQADYYYISVFQILAKILPFPRREETQFPKYYRAVVPAPRDVLTSREYALYQTFKDRGDVKASEVKMNKSLQVLLKKKYLLEIYLTEPSPRYLASPETPTENSALATSILKNSSLPVLVETDNTYCEDMLIIELAGKVLTEKKGSVLILTPKLASTNPLIEMLKLYFQDRVTALFSSLDSDDRIRTLQMIKNRNHQIVIGDRLAIFSPIMDLQFIAITESESLGYKDEDLFIDFRRVALEEGSKTVLFSRSPNIYYKARQLKGYFESYSLCSTKKLSYQLTKRHGDQIFPPHILATIKKQIDDKKQVLIYHSQRGYAPQYICSSCQKAALCPSCRRPLTYYKSEEELRCLQCGYKIDLADYRCLECSGTDFRTAGCGTMQLQDYLRDLFPATRVSRLDYDSKLDRDYQMDLSAFALGDSDILIQAQGITNNNILPKVSLIVVMDIDWILNIADYFIEERYYDILSSLLKAAAEDCQAFLITDHLDNAMVQTIAQQNYPNFYRVTMEKRKSMQAPPYYYLLDVRFKSPNKVSLASVLEKAVQFFIRELAGENVVVVGPYNLKFYHSDHSYKSFIMIKYKNRDSIDRVLKKFLELNMPKDIHVKIEVDPEGE